MSFFFGTIVGLPLSLLFMRIFKGRFPGIASPYFSGALYGFWSWILVMGLLYLDARFDFAGVVKSESGLGFIAMLTSSHTGFITGGLLAGTATAKFFRARK